VKINFGLNAVCINVIGINTSFLLLDNTLFNFLIDAFQPPRGHVHTTMKSGKTEKLQVALIKIAKKKFTAQ
jgi:hypothetical protein